MRLKGMQQERRALLYLERQGLSLCKQNYRSRFGEIDLIMRDQQQTLVFIEVRYRRNALFGTAAESITPQKQQRIIKTAYCYLNQTQAALNYRFDVVAITGGQLEWIQNAFAV